MENKIYITLEGGRVAYVGLTKDLYQKNIDVVVIDFDCDGVPDEDLGISHGERALLDDLCPCQVKDGDIDLVWPNH